MSVFINLQNSDPLLPPLDRGLQLNLNSHARISSENYWGPRFTIAIAMVCGAGLVIGFVPALAVLTAVGFLSAVVGLRWPFIGLLGVGMLCTVDSVAQAYLMTGKLWRWNTFNYWLLIVIIMAAPLLLRQCNPPTRILQGLLAIMAIGLLSSPGKMIGVQAVLEVTVAFGLLVYFLRAVEHDWFWFGVVNGTLAALGSGLYYLERSQEIGLEINKNVWSYFPLTGIFAICLAFHFTPKEHVCRQVVLAALASLNFCWVFLSGSRGAISVALLCGCFILFQLPGMGRRLAVLMGGLSLGLTITTLFPQFREYSLDYIGQMFEKDSDITERTSMRSDLALGAWRMFESEPMGVGTGGFAYEWSHLLNAHGIHRAGRGEFKGAHSEWARTLAENGIVGFLLLLSYVSAFCVLGWHKRHEGLFALGALASSSLGIAFLSVDFSKKGLWLMAVAITVLFYRKPVRKPTCRPLVVIPSKILRSEMPRLAVSAESRR